MKEKIQKSAGKKYIVYNKLIYGLEPETYHELNLLEISYRHAKSKAEEKEDMMLAYDEYNDLNNFLTWIVTYIKPVSSEWDNFDLHRYDKVCQKCSQQENGDDLPF